MAPPMCGSVIIPAFSKLARDTSAQLAVEVIEEVVFPCARAVLTASVPDFYGVVSPAGPLDRLSWTQCPRVHNGNAPWNERP